MTTRDWSSINSGAAFEGLVATLVFFEDPNAALFGRRGIDGGQDVRSGDGLLVFQAKHHKIDSPSKAIADAKKEVKKIARYLESTHSRSSQWKDVLKWRLVTNTAFNPTDLERWKEDIVPAFAALGLVAEYWERANLDALLDKHPEVHRAFFQGENRALLTLPEAQDSLRIVTPFLPRTIDVDFQGRDREFEQVIKFLESEKKFLLINGPGGVGKTRFLYESGIHASAEWQVLWANVASMESGKWFDAIAAERKTLLLVDEPDNERLLQLLVEQIGKRTGRAMSWKVAVAVRSPKDPVVRFLTSPGTSRIVEELGLSSLPVRDAKAFCLQLIDTGTLSGQPSAWKEEAADKLSKLYNGFPVWISLAIEVLERTGNTASVPSDATDLAALYLMEIVQGQQDFPAVQVTALLRWIAMLGVVNREDDTVITILSTESGFKGKPEAFQCIARLVERRALVEKGARDRLLEVKPDVLRDHILRTWLLVNVGFGPSPWQASTSANELIESVRVGLEKGTVNSTHRAILRSLARTEWLLRLSGADAPLLDSLFKYILESITEMSATLRILCVETLLEIAVPRSNDIVAVSKAFRTSPCTIEEIDGFFGKKTMSQDDVVLELAWVVFHASMADNPSEERRAILEEMCELVEAEEEVAMRRDGKHPNDGKRASQLIGRILSGGPHFWGEFEDEFLAVGLKLLENVATAPMLLSGRIAAINALIGAAIRIERQQTWAEGFAFHHQTIVLMPGSRAWRTRESLLRKIRELLQKDTLSVQARVILWRLFSSAHTDVNRSRLQRQKCDNAELQNELLDNLKWTETVLISRTISLEELTAARKLWDWHVRFDENPENKAIAERLEATYRSDDLANEFDPLVHRNDLKDRNTVLEEKAVALSAMNDSAEIVNFVDRALKFFETPDQLNQLGGVATKLGFLALTNAAVRKYIQEEIKKVHSDPQFQFSLFAVSAWVYEIRRTSGATAAFAIVRDIFESITDPASKAILLENLYGGVRSVNLGAPLSNVEHAFLRSTGDLFLSANRSTAYFHVIGWSFIYEWKDFKNAIEIHLTKLPPELLAKGFEQLVDSIYWGVREFSQQNKTMPSDLAFWLLGIMLKLPNFDRFSGMAEWHLQEIFKVFGCPTVEWLPGALKARMALEKNPPPGVKVRAFSLSKRLSQMVQPIQKNDAAKKEILEATEEIISIATSGDILAHWLPEYVHDIDPEGLIVPRAVSEMFAKLNTSDSEAVRRLAKIGGVYFMNTLAWRTIAAPALAIAQSLDERERNYIYHALTDPRPQSYHSLPGEIPDTFITKERAANSLLANETDPLFKSFWKWNHEIAKYNLQRAEDEAKEEKERGE